MNLEPTMDKAALRRRLQALLKGFPPEERAQASSGARDVLRRQKVWQEAGAILFYSPLPGELDLMPLIEEAKQAGKAVALPRYIRETGTYEAVEVTDHGRDCAPGKFGIMEPGPHCQTISLKRLDLALAPGIGFDVSGRRLGRGRGFYDRLLEGIAATKCGVALDQQVVRQLPAERHDVSMNYILTPTRWLEIAKDISV